MKREARLLLDTGVASLILSVEHFNKVDESGSDYKDLWFTRRVPGRGK